ncbi:MAG: hypothetical protein HY927_05280 [Elusimicrobia bacterium]|nr:hypothetical protein [Elusimicrobiota bacterium]
MKTILLALLALGAWSWGAIGYSKYAHPRGEFLLEYPSDWKRDYGMQTVWLQPPGRDIHVKVALELHPYGRKEAATPSAFVDELMQAVGTVKKLDAREEAKVAGRKADKLSFTETIEPKGQYGQRLPGPLQQVYYVVPVAPEWFYVLKIEGIGEPFRKTLPEFDRIAQKVELKGPASPASKPASRGKPKPAAKAKPGS